MRSSTIATVLFAAGALSTPVLDRRVLVTEQVIVTVTDYVTAGNLPPSTLSSSMESPKVKANYVPHSRHHHRSSTSKPVVAVPETTASFTAVEAFIPPFTDIEAFVPSSTAVESFVPPPTSSAAVEAVVPPPTSTKADEAPETTKAPSAESKPVAVNDDLPKTKVAGLTSEDEVYKGLSLRHHNVHRSNHSVPALEWNQTLADFAKEIAQTCVYDHDLSPGGGGYGQNIAAGTEAGNIASVLSNGFYNGEVLAYPSFGSDNPDMSNFHIWGHFSQMVWEATESVGCYTYTCSPPGADAFDCKPDGTSYLSGEEINCRSSPESIPTAAIFTVCNYYPAGNFNGEYHNVKAGNGAPTVEMTDEGVVVGL